MKKIELELEVKRYGNTMVAYIPKSVADALHIEVGDRVLLLVGAKNAVKD
jgi:antitoxin component of MazEF toxin-antitoxin module